jgi:3-methyladenine DNA glycosylase AlkD
LDLFSGQGININFEKPTVTKNPVATYVNAVNAALLPHHDSERAIAMAAYMKNHFPFLGVPMPARRKAVKGIGKPELAAVDGIARALWKRKEREYHYVAVDFLDGMVKKLEPLATLTLIEELTLKNSWWDSVDGLASVGSKVLRLHPDARAVVGAWSAHESFWVNRLAILHQNGWREMTDKKVLFKLCLAHAHNPEFFVRKAIGWALREYAWINPQAVQAFVEANRSKLSALSAREALKNLAG